METVRIDVSDASPAEQSAQESEGRVQGSHFRGNASYMYVYATCSTTCAAAFCLHVFSARRRRRRASIRSRRASRTNLRVAASACSATSTAEHSAVKWHIAAARHVAPIKAASYSHYGWSACERGGRGRGWWQQRQLRCERRHGATRAVPAEVPDRRLQICAPEQGVEDGRKSP